MFEVSCTKCNKVNNTSINGICECGGLLDVQYRNRHFSKQNSQLGMWKYRDRLPIKDNVVPVSLGEGNTPLLVSRITNDLSLFYKNESQNPTGSIKDRALSVAITKAKELGNNKAVLFSAGSTGISAAAYAASSGLDLTVFVGSTTPAWRYFQIQLSGARVIQVDAGADLLMNLLEDISREKEIYQLTTCRRANPYQAEAPKTISYEIVDQLAEVPDWVVLPIGGGGSLSGVWKGFKELYGLGVISTLPRLLGVQVKGYHALALAYESNLRDEKTISSLLDGEPEVDTSCTKLTHKFPHDSLEVLEAIDQSKGAIISADDPQVLEATEMIAKTDGLFVEPSSALAIAGLLQAKQGGLIKKGSVVVACLTGSAFRELPFLEGLFGLPEIQSIIAERDALMGVLDF